MERLSGYVKFAVADPIRHSLCSAFLPSSFAMYFVTLASAFNMEPSSSKNPKRTLVVTTLFATAAIVGWPFALALSLPFVMEELFLYAGDIVPAVDKPKWMVSRWMRFARSVAIAALIFVRFIQASKLCPADLLR